jgi:hypothetical protein
MTPIKSTPVREVNPRLTNLTNIIANSEEGSPRNSGTKNDADDDDPNSDELDDDEEQKQN